MAKWRITTDIETKTSGDRNGFKNFIKSKRLGKAVFTIDRDTLEDDGEKNRNQITLSDEVRVNNKLDADAYAEEIKDHLSRVSNSAKIRSVIITKHLCPHEQGDFQFYDCRTDERAQFEEFFRRAR